MMRILVKWLLSAGALLLVASIYGGVQVQDYSTALWAVIIISLVNLFVRPLLVILSLPATVLTLGLFLFIINGLVFWMASGLVPGWQVDGFWAAVWGALIYAILGVCIESLLAGLFPK